MLVACVLGFGCDAQRTEDYPGEAVWTLEGAIVNKGVEIDDDTSGAILWSNLGTHLEMLERVDVEGNFPAEFTLRTYEPPPFSATFSLADVGIAAVRIAMGLFVAVDDEAPFYPKVLPEGEPRPDPALAPGESLSSDDRAWLRGGAPGHMVLYLDAEPPASALCLADFSAGHNLIALGPATGEEVDESSACAEGARREALATYNAEHGTAYAEPDLWNDEQAQQDVGHAAKQLECETGCDIFKLKTTVVSLDERVTLEMEENPELVDWH